jgi:Conjugative transposon protein TcpC
MVRGPKSGNGSWSSVYFLDSAGLAPPRALYGEMDPLAADVMAAGSLAAPGGIDGGWPGAGGRWLLWPLRVVLWTSLLVVAFRGVTAIVFTQGPAPAGGGPRTGSTAGAQFPVAMAEAFAAEFGRVYLSVSPQNQGLREQALAAFVPASVAAADPNLGWNGAGQLDLQLEQVAGITVQDPRHAVVTLLAMVNAQLMELGVPVAVSGGAVVVSGEPAWLPAPPQAPLPAAVSGRSDPAAQSQLMDELPAFFEAYADSDSAVLSKFAARGVPLTGLGGAVTFGSIGALYVPPGGATRQITVTVIWQLPEQPGSAAENLGMASKLEMTYGMSVVDLHTGKWYVKEIGASTKAVGAR